MILCWTVPLKPLCINGRLLNSAPLSCRQSILSSSNHDLIHMFIIAAMTTKLPQRWVVTLTETTMFRPHLTRNSLFLFLNVTEPEPPGRAKS